MRKPLPRGLDQLDPELLGNSIEMFDTIRGMPELCVCVYISVFVCVYQEDAGAQVGLGGSEEEASTGLQQGAGHLNVVMGEV